jgi:hypothetical protein
VLWRRLTKTRAARASRPWQHRREFTLRPLLLLQTAWRQWFFVLGAGDLDGARYVRLVRLQHLSEIGVPPVIAHARQRLAHCAHPALTTVKENYTLAEIVNGHRLIVEASNF